MNDIPTLKIGNLEINPPIIQGGMGVRISKAGLAAAVAKTGCGGVIATAGLGDFEELKGAEARRVCEETLREEIRNAKKLTDGPIGVNIMVALTDFDDLVKASIDENVDMIISGAGLPMDLPKYLGGKDIKLIPIVSSGRTFKLICRRWKKHYDKTPDAVVVEGPMAGGHLGYTHES
ncbi:MAG: nitronate monooxygenase, partial [Anaerohalosphaera sp.]|nr:nitronate monooxygenase [Anaerohalosphaera sp.]